MIILPHLELGPADPHFDEAVITIGGREEDTITVACEGSRAIAEQIVVLVNAYRQALADHHTETAAALERSSQ